MSNFVIKGREFVNVMNNYTRRTERVCRLFIATSKDIGLAVYHRRKLVDGITDIFWAHTPDEVLHSIIVPNYTRGSTSLKLKLFDESIVTVLNPLEADTSYVQNHVFTDRELITARVEPMDGRCAFLAVCDLKALEKAIGGKDVTI